MKSKVIYRISFINQDSVYEIYAQEMKESDLFGFLEVQELIFGEQSSLVVDPSEERLKLEFQGVHRTYIPMHSIIRIDEVTKRGTAKIKDKQGTDAKISHFPVPGKKLD